MSACWRIALLLLCSGTAAALQGPSASRESVLSALSTDPTCVKRVAARAKNRTNCAHYCTRSFFSVSLLDTGDLHDPLAPTPAPNFALGLASVAAQSPCAADPLTARASAEPAGIGALVDPDDVTRALLVVAHALTCV